jgi:hypothetical protein
MDISYPGFGTVTVAGRRYDHDVVIAGGVVRPRNKMPSKRYRSRYGHTPLSAGEDLPWSPPQLVIGTGATGRLPIMPEVVAAAAERDIELVAVPTAAACQLLAAVEATRVFAVLHVTC